ncbi:MAG: lipocalin family protein [Gemmatimonadetes bacterium]|nr:lipocalin family protein [Gemmatimonadota bacterium]
MGIIQWSAGSAEVGEAGKGGLNRAIGILLLAAAASACGDSTGLDPNDLEGTWVASVWELTNPASASQSVDMLAAGGSMTIVFRSDGTFTSTILEPNETVPDVDTGTYEVVGSALTIAESGQGSPTLFQAVRDGSTLTLTSSDEDYDWDDDGTDDPANMRIVLNRQ